MTYGQGTDRLKAFLRPPKSLLARVRYIFLLIAILATALTIPPMLAATEPWLQTAALAGILWLVWYWSRGYGRGGFSYAGTTFEGLVVLVIGLALDTPLHVLGLAYNGLVFRSLYGERRDVAGAVLAYLGAFLLAATFSPFVAGPSVPLAEVLPHVLGLTLLAIVFHLLAKTLVKQERMVTRERTLREAGAALVATQDRESVYRVAVDTAFALARENPKVRVGLSVGSTEEMSAVASAGDHASELPGKRLNVHLLPDHLRERLLAKRSIEVEGGEAAELRRALGMSPTTRPFFMVPLFTEDELRGTLVAASGSALPREVKDGLEALGFQVALALESVAFAEDRHWCQSEVRFRSLIQNSSDIVILIGADGTINYIAPSVRQFLGYSPGDLIGKDAFAFLHPDDVTWVQDFHAEIPNVSDRRAVIEVRLRHLDGSWRHFEVISNNLLDDPDVRGIILNSRDITERRQAEERLEKSEAQLAEAQRVARIGSWEMHIPTNTALWSDELYRVCGLEPQESTPFETFAELIHPDDAEFVRGMIEKTFQDHEPFAYDHRLIRPDGEVRMLHAQGEVFVDEADVPVRIVGTIQDVTEQRQAEEESRLLRTVALEMSEAEDVVSALSVALRRVCEATGWTIGQAWVPNTDGTALECSPAWYTGAEHLTEFRAMNEALVLEPGVGLPGCAWSSKRPAWTLDIMESNYPRAPIAAEFGVRTGVDIPVLAGSEVVAVLDFFVFEQREEDERLVKLISGVAAQLGSVIRRKQAEEALRESEANLAEAQQIAHLGSWSVEPLKPGMPRVKREMRWSDEMYRIFGFAPLEFAPTSESPVESVHPRDREYVIRALEDSKSRGEPSLTLEHRVLRPDGEVRFVQAQMETAFDENGEIFRRFGTVLDITDRKRAEEALRKSEAFNRAVVDTASDAIITMSKAGLINSFNRAAEDIFGYSSENVVGQPLRMLMPERFRALHEVGFRRYLETSEAHILGKAPVELAGLRKDGIEFPLELSLGEMHEGEELLFTGIIRDITDRKRIEDTLRASEASLTQAQRIAHLGSWEHDLIAGEVRWSEEMYRIFGFAPGEVTPSLELLAEVIHPQDRELAPEAFRSAIEKQEHFSFEHRVLWPDGEVRVVQAQGEAAFDPSGRPISIIGTSLDVTDRKRVEEEVRRSESRLLAAQRIARVGDWSFDVTNNEAHWSEEMYRIFGLDPQRDTLTYKEFLRLVHPGDRRLIQQASRAALSGEVRSRLDYRAVRPDGEVRFVHSQYEIEYDTSGRVAELVGTLQDITELRQAEEELRQSEERFRSLVQNSLDVVMVVDADATVLYYSPSIEAVIGHKPEEFLGKNALEVVPIHPDDLSHVRDVFSYLVENPGVNYSMEMRMLHADGSWRTVEATANNLLDDPSVGDIVINYRDITERKVFEQQLKHQAFHDALTGLPNRVLFIERLEHALPLAGRRRESVAVLFLDLDNFKIVNDSLGHEAGDRLLIAVAQRLQACLRSADTLARLSGDEFAILLEGIEEINYTTGAAKRIGEALRGPFIVEGREVFVTASIGIALGSSSRDRPGDLLRNADLAMYRAKETGKARYEVFDPLLNERAVERLRLEGELRRALKRNEFRVYYQPNVLLETGKVVGAEALVRWEHPERGLLSPATFIPLAEETGLIVPLGKWVLEEACRQAKEWYDQHPTEPPLTVSVNLSARQFRHPLLFEEISGILERSGLEAGALTLEITETVVMKGDEHLIGQLRELRASGVRLAIDDFGTGYSSLSYLSRFPVDYLKIDRSFVDDLGKKPEARKLVSGIIELASSLGLHVIAEGIETTEQLGELKEMGCEIGQGYYFARPLPAGEIPPLL